MRDLERQLRAYAETLDEAAPSAEQIAEAAAHGAGRRTHRRPRSWVVIAGAAAVAGVTIGSVIAVGMLRDEGQQAATTVTATTSGPPTTTATTTTPTEVAIPPNGPSPYIRMASDEPIYGGGVDGEVGGLPMVSAGPVVRSGGTYHAVFSAGGDRDVWDTVYHATSPDGSTWLVDTQPSSLPGVEGASDLRIGSLGQLDDGTWYVYYHVAFDVGGHGNHIYEYSIRRATATTPDGPWVPDPEPALLPGGPGAWDGASVSHPSVVRDGSTWLMFYTGHASKEPKGDDPSASTMDLGGASAMGLATSTDGVTWIRQPTPVFVGSSDAAWEEGAIARTTVARHGDGFVVVYAGRTGGSRGVAVSTDGIEWERIADQPALTGIDVPRPAIFSTYLLEDAGRLRLYVADGGYRTTSAIYEMTLELP
jgi:hypothetical protein